MLPSIRFKRYLKGRDFGEVVKEKTGYVIKLVAYFLQRKYLSGVAYRAVWSEFVVFLFDIVLFHPKTRIADVGLIIDERVDSITVLMVADMAEIAKYYFVSLLDLGVEANLAVIVAS